MLSHSANPVNAILRMPRKRQTGASLLEVLIAMLVMSYAITGIALLMAATLQHSQTSLYQLVALQAATELAEAMRANTDGFMADAYGKTDTYSSTRAAATVPNCAAPARCSSSEIASIDKAQLANRLRLSLPGGDFQMLRNGSRADIWIMWLEPTSTASMVSGTAPCRAWAISAGGDLPRCLYLWVAL
jgi:type IV pilus assembly protein PilV